jgi:transposase
MKDVQLYQQILGDTRPWRVSAVTLKRDQQEIEIRMELPEEALWGCPTCRQRMHVHGYETRRWRHLDSCQYKTMLVAEVPRVKCEEHGTVQVQVPWAEKHSRFTALFERLAIDVLLECSTRASCDILSISWAEADRIKQRAVERGLGRRRAEPIRRLCIDEKAVGWGHQYVTIVTCADGDLGRVLAVEDGREEKSLDRFWKSLSPQQRAGVETVAMDMWEAYWNSTAKHVPGAVDKIVYDNFHLARYMNNAVDEVRRREHAQMQARGKETLKGTRQLWLYGWENLPRKWAHRFRLARQVATKTARAWRVKELLRSFWGCADEAEALAFFRRWAREAMSTRLEPVKEVVRRFRKHWRNIVTYFRHRLSNAVAEGINSRIQYLIQKACGYRNRKRFTRDVFFHLGGLDLYPNLAQ